MNKSKKMKATSLRRTMIVIIIIVIILSTLGFYYVQGILNTYAISVGKTVSESTISGANPQAIKNLQEEIAESKVTIDKVNAFFTSTQDYQNQTVKDLNKYAANTGISIKDYNFTRPATADSKGIILPGGVATSYITVTLGNPIPFTNLMKFIKSIESNTPKMQITGISLTHDQFATNTVTVEPLTIEVYTR